MAAKRKVYELALTFTLGEKQADVRKKINDSLIIMEKGNYGITQAILHMSDLTGLAQETKPIKRVRKPKPTATAEVQAPLP